jgi:2-phosphosulfolactate phosphatase
MIDTNDSWRAQLDYACRMEWGRRGVRAAAKRGDIVVIVDVLSFTSAVATAVQHGAMIYPCLSPDEVPVVAERAGAHAAVRRADVPSRGRYSLSPAGYIGVPAGTKVAVWGPNGAVCARHATSAEAVLAGALLNATAVGRHAARLHRERGKPVTVVACGERWTDDDEDGALRVAIEDYLGAGAILSAIDLPASPEADLCAAAFQSGRNDLPRLIRDCLSGRELRAYPSDLEHAAKLDLYHAVPILREARFVAATI